MPNTNNQKGFAHIILPIVTVIVVAVTGVFLLVGSHASPIPETPSDKPPQKHNPYTRLCPGNTVKYGVIKGETDTTEARERVFGSYRTTSNLTTIQFMGKPVTVNKKIENCMKAVEWDLLYKYHTNYKLHYIWGDSGVDANNPSYYFHPYGGAVDINPPDNPFYKDCRTSCPHDMPNTWVKAFKAHGFFWGGKYKTSKDYMHFEWHGQ